MLAAMGGLYTVLQTLRGENIQKALAPKYQWEFWPTWARVLCVFVFSFLGAIVSAVAGGMSWSGAAVSAVIIALGAMGTHGAGKALPQYKADEKISLTAKIPNPHMPKVKMPPLGKTAEQRTQDATMGVDDVGPLEF
jgi:lipopolysaccharide export LptBFGC system permease protein LptF